MTPIRMTRTATPEIRGEAARCGDGVIRLDLDPGEEGYEGCDGGDGCSRRCEPLPVGLFAGAHFTCAILSGGRFVCWGDNRYDQLGNSAFGQSDLSPYQSPSRDSPMYNRALKGPARLRRAELDPLLLGSI